MFLRMRSKLFRTSVYMGQVLYRVSRYLYWKGVQEVTYLFLVFIGYAHCRLSQDLKGSRIVSRCWIPNSSPRPAVYPKLQGTALLLALGSEKLRRTVSALYEWKFSAFFSQIF